MPSGKKRKRLKIKTQKARYFRLYKTPMHGPTFRVNMGNGVLGLTVKVRKHQAVRG